VRAYDQEALRRLMKTGEALEGRDAGLMTQMAAGRFSALHPEETDTLNGYISETGGLDRADSHRDRE